MRKVALTVVAVVLIAVMVCAFTACDTGKYKSDNGYVNLKIGGKYSAEVKTLGGGTKTYSGKYNISKADEDGVKTVTFYNKDGDVIGKGSLKDDTLTVLSGFLGIYKK